MGQKRFCCPECDLLFTEKASLKKHLKRFHKKNIDEYDVEAILNKLDDGIINVDTDKIELKAQETKTNGQTISMDTEESVLEPTDTVATFEKRNEHTYASSPMKDSNQKGEHDECSDTKEESPPADLHDGSSTKENVYG